MADTEFPKRRYTLKDCCAILQIQEDQFREFVRTGIFPEGRKRGGKLLYWTPEDIRGMTWLEENLERFAWYRIPDVKPTKGKTVPIDDENDE